jgi:hypothetical protein
VKTTDGPSVCVVLLRSKSDVRPKYSPHKAEVTGIVRVLNSKAFTVYKIDYSDVDEKPETLFIHLKRLVGPSGRFSNFPLAHWHF